MNPLLKVLAAHRNQLPSGQHMVNQDKAVSLHLPSTLFRHRKRQDGALQSLVTMPDINHRTRVQCGHSEELSPMG